MTADRPRWCLGTESASSSWCWSIVELCQGLLKMTGCHFFYCCNSSRQQRLQKLSVVWIFACPARIVVMRFSSLCENSSVGIASPSARKASLCLFRTQRLCMYIRYEIMLCSLHSRNARFPFFLFCGGLEVSCFDRRDVAAWVPRRTVVPNRMVSSFLDRYPWQSQSSSDWSNLPTGFDA
jgi:hypothetical protein